MAEPEDNASPYAPTSRVTVRNQLGGVTSVERRQLDAQSDTLREETPEEEAARIRKLRGEIEHDTVGSRARSFAGGATDALTLGFVNPWEDDREFHPVYSGLGKVGGLAATLLVPGAGEENLARVGLEGAEALAEAAGVARAVRGAESVGEIARGSKLARGLGSVVERTPLGQVNRLSEAAGGLIEGTGVGSRILRTAVEGATGGGAIGLGTELSRQLLDSNAEFSGENLLGSTFQGAALGGLIGGAGSALSEGVTAARPLLSRITSKATRSEGIGAEEFAASAGRRAPTAYSEATDLAPGGRAPLGPLLDPKGVTLVDSVASRSKDLESLSGRIEELIESPALLKQAGLSKQYLQESLGTVQRELNGLKALSRFEDAPLARLAEDAHANDLIGVRISQSSERVPSRWSDAEVRQQTLIARDKALDDLASKRARGLPVSQAEEDAVRYSAQLSAGRPQATAEIKDSLLANAARGLINRVPGGRLLSQGLGAATGVGIAEHVITNGVGGLIGHAALPLAGGIAASKVIQAAFRDPHVGGIIAANVSSVLNSTAVPRGSSRPASTDPRRALRDLGDRARTVTPQQVYASTATSLSHAAGSSPNAVQNAAQAASNRHQQLLDLLDSVDPQATTPGKTLLGRPLPAASGARRVADFIRMAGNPTNFLVAALQGRLTRPMMAIAEGMWPATVQRARAELLGALQAGGGDRLGPEQRRSVELILGPSAMGDTGRAASYSRAMRASQERAMQPAGPGEGPKAGTVRTAPPAPTPAQRAANPGQYR